MLSELLAARKLPPILNFADGRPVSASDFSARRREMLDLLSREMYGFPPEETPEVFPENLTRTDELCGGAVTRRLLSLSFDCPGGRFSFPIQLYTPVGKPPAPVFVLIAFPAHIIQNDIPVSEILDRGYALAYFIHDDVTFDGGERRDGLWPLYPRVQESTWGALSMWAFAASRVLDYLGTVPEVDARRAAVVGHSRLGKTALLAGARDERFSLTISNNSGCGGAALSREKGGEQIGQIIDRFPYWLAESYFKYAGRPEAQPFDQHFLLSCVAPRHLYIASAGNDDWADPVSEFLSAYAAGEAWQLLGRSSLVAPDALPAPGDVFHDGDIGYHLRPGNHFLTRQDWNLFMDYRDRHGV